MHTAGEIMQHHTQVRWSSDITLGHPVDLVDFWTSNLGYGIGPECTACSGVPVHRDMLTEQAHIKLQLPASGAVSARCELAMSG